MTRKLQNFLEVTLWGKKEIWQAIGGQWWNFNHSIKWLHPLYKLYNIYNKYANRHVYISISILGKQRSRGGSEPGLSVEQGSPAMEVDCRLLLSLVPLALTIQLIPQQISLQMFSLWQWDIFIAFYLTSPWELSFAFTQCYQETKATKTHFNFSSFLALLLSDNGGIRPL